jgi:predicted acetyltransferase
MAVTAAERKLTHMTPSEQAEILRLLDFERQAVIYPGTRERFRKRGLFTQLVATRIREAMSRGVAYVCVDALPTSEPILRKRGFEIVTYTQPFCITPS